MKIVKEIILILVGAFIGLTIEVAFESPVRNLLCPDKYVEVEFIFLDENTREPIPNLEVLLVNIGEYDTGINGEIRVNINQSTYKEVAIAINDAKGVYRDKSSNFEVPENEQTFTVLLSKINY